MILGKTAEKVREGLAETVAMPARQAIFMAGTALIVAVIALIVVMTRKAG